MWLLTWRYRRFHVSYVLAWCAVGVLAGVFAGQYITPQNIWSAVSLGVLMLGVSLRSGRWFACVLALVAGLVVGMIRGGDYAQQLRHTSELAGKQLTLVAATTSDPVLMNGSDTWQVQLGSLRVGTVHYEGEAYATVVSNNALKRGDELTLVGKAQTGFGNFRLSIFRAHVRHVIRSPDVFLQARDVFAAGTRRVMPEPEASLGLGFLVGEKSALPSDLTEQLKIVGLTHIIVASGYNLTIFVRFARRLLARRSRYLALAGSLLLVAGYILVSGFSPSMNRAAVVTFLSLLAWYYGRTFHPVQLILYVASVSALVYPTYVWTDLGWLLSFLAFGGVLVVAPIVTRLLYRKDREPGALARLVIETTAAEAMTLPVIALAFGYIPVLALVANVAVASIIPFAMFFTFVAGVVGLMVPVLSVLALPAGILTAAVVAVAETLSRPDWARLPVTLTMTGVLIWYGLLGIVLVFVWKRRRVNLRASSVVE